MTAVSRKGVRRAKHPYQPSYHLNRAQLALGALQGALQLAQEAGAPYLCQRIRLAISSARGAVRNAGYRVTRARLIE